MIANLSLTKLKLSDEQLAPRDGDDLAGFRSRLSQEFDCFQIVVPRLNSIEDLTQLQQQLTSEHSSSYFVFRTADQGSRKYLVFREGSLPEAVAFVIRFSDRERAIQMLLARCEAKLLKNFWW